MFEKYLFAQIWTTCPWLALTCEAVCTGSICQVRTPHKCYLYERVRNGQRSGVQICEVQPVNALFSVCPSALTEATLWGGRYEIWCLVG